MAMFKNILVIILILHISAYTDTRIDQPTIQYLKGVHRFNNTGYIDYYFSCNAFGGFLRWQFNDEPLTGFNVGHAGRVVVESRTAFQYTATLLSSQIDPKNNQEATLDSVLVVSFNGEPPNTFEVKCSSSSNPNFSTIAVNELRDDVVSGSSNNGEVMLVYIISYPIVLNKNKTHIFVCETQYVLLNFEINGSLIEFSVDNGIGQDRTVLSEDGSIVNIQGVLIARHRNTSTSLLFVSEDSDVNVTCFFGSHQVQLSSSSRNPTPEPSAILPDPTMPPSSSLAPTTSVLTDATEMTSSKPHDTQGPRDVYITCGFFLFFIIILLAIIATLCWRTRQSARYSPEAPKYNIPAEEKELPTKNMEKLVNGTRNIIRSLCGNKDQIATTRRHSERSNQGSYEEMQPLIRDFSIQPNCCNMEDIPVFVTHELEQQPEDKLAAEWIHACPVYLDKPVPSENYSLGNPAPIVGAKLAAGSFSKMFYISEDKEAVYIMEDHSRDSEDRVINLLGQDDVEKFIDIAERVPAEEKERTEEEIEREREKPEDIPEETQKPDVRPEIPDVSPDETEIPKVSPEETETPEGSPEETEIPEGSPDEEIPDENKERPDKEREVPEVISEVNTKDVLKICSEKAIKEWPGELFDDSEDEVLNLEEENVFSENPRDVYDLCPVNLIVTEWFGAVEVTTSSDTSDPWVSYLHLTYLGYPTNEEVRKLQEFNLSIFQCNPEALLNPGLPSSNRRQQEPTELSILPGYQSNPVSGRGEKLQYDLEGIQPLRLDSYQKSSVFTPGGFCYRRSDEDWSQSGFWKSNSFLQKIVFTSAVIMEEHLSISAGNPCVFPSALLEIGIFFDG